MCLKNNGLLSMLGLLGAVCAPVFGAVQIQSVTPSIAGPQSIGTTITWTVTATDTNAGPLTFQFNVTHPGATTPNMVRDFNVGTHGSGTWTSQPFVWTPTGSEGLYQIQVVAKDFTSGESATQTATYQMNSLVTGGKPVAAKTANPLVALFSSPACPLGSTLRVQFRRSGSKLASLTPWLPCKGTFASNVEIAGLRPNSTYNMFAQVHTATSTTNGPVVSFVTGALPGNVPFPGFKVVVPAGTQTDR